MKRIIACLQSERKFFLLSFAFFLIIALAMMVQNYIRYGWHADYDPMPALIYISIGFFSIVLFVPFFYTAVNLFRDRFIPYFWWLTTALIVVSLALHYLFSSGVLWLSGYTDTFFYQSFMRFYFGRAILFHVLYFFVAGMYAFRQSGLKNSKQISGTLGRKKITIKAELAKWIEADDHYLRIHFEDGVILKRSTLDRMTKELDPDFIRIHRKYLVNRHQIVGKEKNKRDEYLILSTGERLKVGRSYLPLNLFI